MVLASTSGRILDLVADLENYPQVGVVVQRKDAGCSKQVLHTHLLPAPGTDSAVLEMNEILDLSTSFSPATPELGAILAEAVPEGCSSLRISDPSPPISSCLPGIPSKEARSASEIREKLQVLLARLAAGHAQIDA
ncbi:uncharacterized protein LOC112268919 [Brachypodium distachyon]|uniref:Uncharacterized protein n=1 Tax=Brachypodium distachyon TaxID=15368 RepID=A0A2K2CPK2_BRADI|nr:uncharacterized protein LOC112268919 [Brachypodium distachyon]PNT63952.1 hypothetical protein BRADI_4g22645v3 [Brachypodium distachyon]|eukprot:XP_024310962.1 uncharacterized protein LOC112268919 [Brachypodium distachyon]